MSDRLSMSVVSEQPAAGSRTFKSSVALLALVSVLPLAAGYAREAVAAYSMGTTARADAFSLALHYVDGLAAVAALGIASYALVPVFTAMLTERRSADSFRLVETASLWLLALMAPLVLVASLHPAWTARMLAPGFNAGQAALLAELVPAAAWSATLILLNAVAAGNLQARSDYSWPVVGRAVLALSIAAGLWASARSHSLRGACCGLVIGAGLQLLLQWWRLCRAGWVPAWPRWTHADLARTLNLALPALTATVLTNLLTGGVQSWMASGLSEGSLSSVNYAQRTLNLASSLTMSIATVSLTEISLALRRGPSVGRAGVEVLGDCLETGVFLLAPFVALLLVWPEPLLQLLFMRGNYDAVSLHRTAECLRWYALAIVPGFFNSILLRTQPALGRPWSLLHTAAIWAGSTIVTTALLLRVVGASAIPIGFLCGQVAACVWGTATLRPIIGTEPLARIGRYLFRVTMLTLLATVVASMAQWLFATSLSLAGASGNLLAAALGTSLMFALYVGACGWLRDPHLRDFLAEVRGRIGSRMAGRPAGELDRP